jgi:hypothetical protein
MIKTKLMFYITEPYCTFDNNLLPSVRKYCEYVYAGLGSICAAYLFGIFLFDKLCIPNKNLSTINFASFIVVISLILNINNTPPKYHNSRYTNCIIVAFFFGILSHKILLDSMYKIHILSVLSIISIILLTFAYMLGNYANISVIKYGSTLISILNVSLFVNVVHLFTNSLILFRLELWIFVLTFITLLVKDSCRMYQRAVEFNKNLDYVKASTQLFYNLICY